MDHLILAIFVKPLFIFILITKSMIIIQFIIFSLRKMCYLTIFQILIEKMKKLKKCMLFISEFGKKFITLNIIIYLFFKMTIFDDA